MFKNNKKETTFKIDLGNGEEIKTYSQMQNLSDKELEYLNKKLKKCNSFNENFKEWNISSVINMSDMFTKFNPHNNNLEDWNVNSVVALIKVDTQEKKNYCRNNNIKISHYPLINFACLVSKIEHPFLFT